MKKIKWLLIIFVPMVIVGSIVLILVSNSRKREALDLEYINKQFGSDGDIWEAGHAILDHFQPGMTQEEVYEIIIEIDPTLKNHLGGNGIHCNSFDCFEYLVFFKDRFSFEIYFQYDLDLMLIKVLPVSW